MGFGIVSAVTVTGTVYGRKIKYASVGTRCTARVVVITHRLSVDEAPSPRLASAFPTRLRTEKIVLTH